LNAETAEAMSAGDGEAHRWLATAAAMGDAISMVLSSTTVSVAFPNIMAAFGIGQDKAQWASTGFLAAMMIFMLVNPWGQSVFGQRRSYLLALGLFVLGAVPGGTAQSTEFLILGRVIQGACAWWSDYIVALGSVAALATVALVLWQWRVAKLPLPRIDLLVTPQFASAVAVAFVLDAAIYGLTSLVPIFVQIVQHFLATWPGCCSLPGAACWPLPFQCPAGWRTPCRRAFCW